MDIMTEKGWKQLQPKNCTPVNTKTIKLNPWDEKYDRANDPQFAHEPKRLKFGQ